MTMKDPACVCGQSGNEVTATPSPAAPTPIPGPEVTGKISSQHQGEDPLPGTGVITACAPLETRRKAQSSKTTRKLCRVFAWPCTGTAPQKNREHWHSPLTPALSPPHGDNSALCALSLTRHITVNDSGYGGEGGHVSSPSSTGWNLELCSTRRVPNRWYHVKANILINYPLQMSEQETTT